jgi:hypothetical protein
VQGVPPTLGHETQAEFRFAPDAGRSPHGPPAIGSVQELADRRGYCAGRVVDDHSGTAVLHHGCCPGYGCGYGRNAAQPRLDQYTWHTFPGWQTGEHKYVCVAEELGYIRTGTEELDAMRDSQRGQHPSKRAVARYDGA